MSRRRRCFLLVAALSASSPARGDWREELAQPVRIQLDNRSVLSGVITEVSPSTVRIREESDGSEIIVEVGRDRIRRWILPGEGVLEEALDLAASGNHAAAVERLDAIYRRWIGLFAVLPEERLLPLIQAPLSAMEMHEPARAVAFARELRPHLSRADALSSLRDTELLGLYQLKIQGEAREQAALWIESEPAYSGSALGYFVLAAAEFDAGDYEKSRWIALIPAVYSGPEKTDFLEHCYTLAAASAHLLGDVTHRDQLLAEMEQRHLAWVELERFREITELLADIPLPKTDTLEDPSLPDASPPPATHDQPAPETEAGPTQPDTSNLPGAWMPRPLLRNDSSSDP